MRIKKLLIFLISGIVGIEAYSSTLVIHPDTVSLFETQSGVGKDRYIQEWFFKRVKGSGEYEESKVTAQDSLVLYKFDSSYFKFYDKDGFLLLEGQRLAGSTFLIGDIRFYDKGKLERIEHWSYSQHLDTCGRYVFVNSEVPGKEGVWSYYKNDKLRKTETYVIKVVSCEKAIFTCVRITQYYSKDGDVKRRKEKVIWKRTIP